MPTASVAKLDAGRLMRLHAMMTASQVEPTRGADQALVAAYITLRTEMSTVLTDAGADDLLVEFQRLFTPVAGESSRGIASDAVVAVSRATEALVRLRMATGWIQGLLDELSYEDRLRAEAEAKAALEAKPQTGFRQ